MTDRYVAWRIHRNYKVVPGFRAYFSLENLRARPAITTNWKSCFRNFARRGADSRGTDEGNKGRLTKTQSDQKSL